MGWIPRDLNGLAKLVMEIAANLNAATTVRDDGLGLGVRYRCGCVWRGASYPLRQCAEHLGTLRVPAQRVPNRCPLRKNPALFRSIRG